MFFHKLPKVVALFLFVPVVLLMTPASRLYSQSSQPVDTARVKTGIEVLADIDFKPLKGKKVGLITNPTGVNYELKSTIDMLHESDNVELVALFGPEHGVRGNYSAGEKVGKTIDPKTGVPVYSLYGSRLAPTDSMLQDIDVLIYDIQDIGVRSYTYISTMGRSMEAAAENDVHFVVLDRPNPLGGNRIEGPVVEPAFESFVSQFPIPYVYGLTVGELARMLNGEGMIGEQKCRLTVIPMRRWERDMLFEDTGLPWVPTSPHIPYKRSPLYYVSTGILGELDVVSEGVGYTLPFHMYAAPWIEADKMADSLNALNLKGVQFRPVHYKPYYGGDKGKELHGVQIHIREAARLNLMALQFRFMEIHNKMYPEKNTFKEAREPRIRMFDKVVGTDSVRKVFMEQGSYESIEPILNKDVEAFREKSKMYHLYH